MTGFGSVCSGIEAASVAWNPIGWRCAFTAEIDKFPCALLNHYYPTVPNYGDLNEYEQWPEQSIDVLVGGTPCQDFSVAGQRAGMAGTRGGLTMRFLDIVERFAPAWVLWENVPGVLSIDGGRAFGAFLGGLAKRGYGFAYRILDAQYFGLAQRRERVFVVGCSGGRWQRAASVLFDAPRLCWNPPPRRETAKRIAPTVEGRAGRSGANNFATSGGLVELSPSIRAQSQSSHREDSEAFVPVVAPTQTSGPVTEAGHNARSGHAKDNCLIAGTISAANGRQRGSGIQPETLIAHSLTAEGRNFEAQSELAYAVTNPGSGGRTHSRQIAHGMAVRRLTPTEVEALFGFPKNYTLIPYRSRPACDGPRYRALGNSFAVPVVRWIGRRIQAVMDCIEP